MNISTAARKKEMDDARKKKRDDDDEGRKAPKKSRKGGVSSPSKEMATPSPRKTRSMTKKEAETKGATKGATKGVTKAEHIDFWMSGKKLDISRLIKNTIHSPDTDPPGFLFRRLKLCIQLHLPATRQSPRCL
ncbi:hypothetical protein ACEPPN_017103 [Leptodophora sp. 'Broadleaf-Isolate-01']